MPFRFVALWGHVGHCSCLVRALGSLLSFRNFNGRGHATPFVELDLEHVAAPPLRYDPQIASGSFRLGRCMMPHMHTPCGRLLDSSTKLVELAFLANMPVPASMPNYNNLRHVDHGRDPYMHTAVDKRTPSSLFSIG